MNLTVADVSIRQDAEGRFCLNDLHKAAGGETRHKPVEWLRNQKTQELIEETLKVGFPTLVTFRGGRTPGTYVCKELVYAYAMWISPAFHLKVIRAYDELQTNGVAFSERMGVTQGVSSLGVYRDTGVGLLLYFFSGG
ncbi:MAG: KilA-N domain-containing protein [Marinospirillum sp.]|uniref:KilA-N domain-containing protein n=1 Tax=Marinospirillum sp. TaxID=2183934 RepID=UPI0019F253A9|nr:KilA-N domain-containing protein [Marinospirillum sp.]MBE0508026.1 KilA-N domain-containing protein [Marinospirillum sp.]